MLERLLKYGCGVALLFGGFTGLDGAEAMFQRVIAVILIIGAAVWCAVMLIRAAIEDKFERELINAVNQLTGGKTQSEWIVRYFNGEFDPESDEEQEIEITIDPPGVETKPLLSAETKRSRHIKFVI